MHSNKQNSYIPITNGRLNMHYTYTYGVVHNNQCKTIVPYNIMLIFVCELEEINKCVCFCFHASVVKNF